MKIMQTMILGLACALALNAEEVLAAEVSEAQQYTLTINVVGSGRVIEGNKQCTGQCLSFHGKGVSVRLTAVPADEWTFVGWVPDCGQKPTCVVTMNGNQNVTAVFTYP